MSAVLPEPPLKAAVAPLLRVRVGLPVTVSASEALTVKVAVLPAFSEPLPR